MAKNSEKDVYEECIRHMDRDEVVNLLANLIKANSSNPPGNEKKVALVAEKKFRAYQIETEIDDLEGENRANLTARLMGNSIGPNLIYSAHSDVVPATDQNWVHDPFGAEIEGDIMYGRGTVDMKSGAAAMIMALCLLKQAGVPLKGRATFIHTAGEEVHFTGSASYVRKHGVEDMDAIAISEPSNNRILVAERGGLWIKFTSLGRTAHAGLPEEGFNALLPMLELIHTLKSYEFPRKEHSLLGKPTLSITTMHAGTNTNVIPERCEATVDIRTIPGISHRTLMMEINDIIRKMKIEDHRVNIVAEPINDHEPLETDVDNDFVQIAFKTFDQIFLRDVDPGGAYYMTDAVSFLKAKAIPMIIFGPGEMSLIHQPEEHVSISQVCDAVKFYVALAINYLS